MAQVNEIQAGRIFRHKGGKLYKIENCGDSIRWGGACGADGKRLPGNQTWQDTVYATQWQVNEKYPNGREYQAARELKIADLTAID